MIKGKNHVIFDEITYDRDALEQFLSKFDGCVDDHANWQEFITGIKQYNVPEGYNVINTAKLEGKKPPDYPEVRQLMNLFKIPIHENHVVLSHYEVGFRLDPHTDHQCKASVMFPILPRDGGAQIIFHDVPKPYTVATDYTDYIDKIDYKVKYSTVNPTMFTTQVPHSVERVTEARTYLKFMIFDYTFEELLELHEKGELFN